MQPTALHNQPLLSMYDSVMTDLYMTRRWGGGLVVVGSGEVSSSDFLSHYESSFASCYTSLFLFLHGLVAVLIIPLAADTTAAN